MKLGKCNQGQRPGCITQKLHTMGWWSATPLSTDFDLSIRAAPKSMATICKKSELQQEGDHPIMQGQKHLCLQLECGHAGQVSQPAKAQLRLTLPRRWGSPCVQAQRHVTLQRGAPEHGHTTAAETDVWHCSHKQGWRNLKPACYCSTSPFVRGIKTKIHWMVVTFSKWFLGFGTYCFHTDFLVLINLLSQTTTFTIFFLLFLWSIHTDLTGNPRIFCTERKKTDPWFKKWI